MSNIICIQPCKFVDRVGSKNVTSYGYRCYDSYGSCYNNSWKKKHIDMFPIEIFEKACKEKRDDPDLEVMLGFIKDIKGGVMIGDTPFEWEQIKNIIEE